MGDSDADLGLGNPAPARLRDAVKRVLTEQSDRFPGTEKLRAGAVESVKDEATDAGAALYFQSLLELGYLVASADGLAEDERVALAQLVEHATDAAVDRDALMIHFADLEATCEMLGRRERLVRTAANFEGADARNEAISFATLVAIADGKLNSDEAEVLHELGRHFSLSGARVQGVIDDVARSIRRQLKGDR